VDTLPAAFALSPYPFEATAAFFVFTTKNFTRKSLKRKLKTRVFRPVLLII
jgi:hypothetical protein